MTKRSALSNTAEGCQAGSVHGDSLYTRPNLQNLNALFDRVRHGSHDNKAIQQVNWYPVWCNHVGSSNRADAPVCCKDDYGRKRAFKRAVEVREALNIQHMYLKVGSEGADRIAGASSRG